MDEFNNAATPANSSRLSSGDDPLSANAGKTTPPSTTPHLPKIEDIVRASLEYSRYPALEEPQYHDHDLEARSLISSTLDRNSDAQDTREIQDEEESSTGFEAPTKVEKTMMVTSIGVVLLFSVAAGLTTVCDWVL